MIAYWSRQLTKPERNYSTIEREALAVVAAIKEFYPYLYGFNFTLFTDHNPLTALKEMKDVGGHIARWMLFLQQFTFCIKYKPGKVHGDADALSRRPAGDNGGEGSGGDNGGDNGGEGSGGDNRGTGDKDGGLERKLVWWAATTQETISQPSHYRPHSPAMKIFGLHSKEIKT